MTIRISIPFVSVHTFNDMHCTLDASSHSVPPINAVFDAVLLFGSLLDPTHTFDSSSISEPPIKSSVDPVQSFNSAIFTELYFDSLLDPLVLFDMHHLMSSYKDSLFYATFRFILFYLRSTVLLVLYHVQSVWHVKCTTYRMWHKMWRLKKIIICMLLFCIRLLYSSSV